MYIWTFLVYVKTLIFIEILYFLSYGFFGENILVQCQVLLNHSFMNNL